MDTWNEIIELYWVNGARQVRHCPVIIVNFYYTIQYTCIYISYSSVITMKMSRVERTRELKFVFG